MEERLVKGSNSVSQGPMVGDERSSKALQGVEGRGSGLEVLMRDRLRASGAKQIKGLNRKGGADTSYIRGRRSPHLSYFTLHINSFDSTCLLSKTREI